VANARKVRLIYSNKRKGDGVDAENLARLARLDPKLLYPLKHRGEVCQAHMGIIRSREALVSARTQLVNHVRGAVKSFWARLPKCPATSFHKRAPEHIPEALWPALGPVLEKIGALDHDLGPPRRLDKLCLLIEVRPPLATLWVVLRRQLLIEGRPHQNVDVGWPAAVGDGHVALQAVLSYLADLHRGPVCIVVHSPRVGQTYLSTAA
jgi:hypothetical protein